MYYFFSFIFSALDTLALTIILILKIGKFVYWWATIVKVDIFQEIFFMEQPYPILKLIFLKIYYMHFVPYVIRLH